MPFFTWLDTFPTALVCQKSKELKHLRKPEAEGMSKARRVWYSREGWGVWKTRAHKPCVQRGRIHSVPAIAGILSFIRTQKYKLLPEIS